MNKIPHTPPSGSTHMGSWQYPLPYRLNYSTLQGALAKWGPWADARLHICRSTRKILRELGMRQALCAPVLKALMGPHSLQK